MELFVLLLVSGVLIGLPSFYSWLGAAEGVLQMEPDLYVLFSCELFVPRRFVSCDTFAIVLRFILQSGIKSNLSTARFRQAYFNWYVPNLRFVLKINTFRRVLYHVRAVEINVKL